MENLNPEFALYGSNSECARTKTVNLPIPEVSPGAVSLKEEEKIPPKSYKNYKRGGKSALTGSILPKI